MKDRSDDPSHHERTQPMKDRSDDPSHHERTHPMKDRSDDPSHHERTLLIINDALNTCIYGYVASSV